MQKLKFPVGEYKPNKHPDQVLLHEWIKAIEDFPSNIEHLTRSISIEQLNWKYRPGGWTVKQVIHHCADSHMNSFIRFKLALTEDTPVIRPYFEDRWAELADAKDNNIDDSVRLLKGLHNKWGVLLRSLTKAQLNREFMHPEHGEKFTLSENIGIYAWHCSHHLAHVKNGIESKGVHQEIETKLKES